MRCMEAMAFGSAKAAPLTIHPGSASRTGPAWFRRWSAPVNFLLLPQDERDLTSYLCSELGARLLLSDIAPSGEAQVADDPLRALPPDLPGPAKLGSREIYYLSFWLPEHGAIRTMRDAPEATDPRDIVSRGLTREASDKYLDVIDSERTPMLWLCRSMRMSNHRLAPGTLGMYRLAPPELAGTVPRTHAKAIRWLKRRGVKLDPFLHCPEVADRRPARLGPLWVCVQPHAQLLVQQGLEIWPWNR